MYKVTAFHRFSNDLFIETFDNYSLAKEYFEDIADDIEYEGSYIRHVVLYCGHIKLIEFRA